MLNKKGDVDPLKVIISIVLLLVVALIIIFVFKGKFTKEVGIIDTILGKQEKEIGDAGKEIIPKDGSESNFIFKLEWIFNHAIK